MVRAHTSPGGAARSRERTDYAVAQERVRKLVEDLCTQGLSDEEIQTLFEGEVFYSVLVWRRQ